MARLDEQISSLMSDQPKILWEGKFWGGSDQKIIGYGLYTYENSKRDTVEWFIVGLAAQKNYISIYVNATDGRSYLTEQYAGKLGKVKIGKSSISFNSIDDINLDELSNLIVDAKRLMT